MRPDLFITIAFVALVLTLGLVGLAVGVHERRRERAANGRDAATPS